MWKRVILVALCLFLLCSTAAYAAEPRAITVQPSLEFSGSTALCEVTVFSYGKSIEVDLELWCGSTLIDSWTKSGTSVVTISEETNVISGRTYTLKVYGLCGGIPYEGTPVSRKNP